MKASPYTEAESEVRHQTTRDIANDVMVTVHGTHTARMVRRQDNLAAWNCSHAECQATAARLMEMLRRCQK